MRAQALGSSVRDIFVERVLCGPSPIRQLARRVSPFVIGTDVKSDLRNSGLQRSVVPARLKAKFYKHTDQRINVALHPLARPRVDFAAQFIIRPPSVSVPSGPSYAVVLVSGVACFLKSIWIEIRERTDPPRMISDESTIPTPLDPKCGHFFDFPAALQGHDILRIG